MHIPCLVLVFVLLLLLPPKQSALERSLGKTMLSVARRLPMPGVSSRKLKPLNIRSATRFQTAMTRYVSSLAAPSSGSGSTGATITETTTSTADSNSDTLIAHAEELADFIRSKDGKLIVITGAGVSTSSGIPDYRGPNGSYRRGHVPMKHQEFVQSAKHRQRYWARSIFGWKSFYNAQPNACHTALAQLEFNGYLSLLVTQNVDRLHSKAGSQRVVDLHGRSDRVKCLSCEYETSRISLHQQLEALNVDFIDDYNRARSTSASGQERADGDMELGLSEADYARITLPCCPRCTHGILKPDVVYFGDNVPTEKVRSIFDAVDSDCAGLLVLGTSLEVYSAYRFVSHANKRNLPIAIINTGETRAEREKLPNIVFKSEANCADLMKIVATKLER
jgi:NAD-dependent SIR2 family protein deacetylase